MIKVTILEASRSALLEKSINEFLKHNDDIRSVQSVDVKQICLSATEETWYATIFYTYAL